jgi:signal transduction histidine kinase
MISRNADKIRKLIDNLLDFAKMEAGFWELKITDLKMRDIMEEIPVTVKPVASLKNIEVVMGTSLSGQKCDFEKLLFRGDMDQIGRVIVNFVTNAVKYTPENGKVCIWAEQAGNDIKVVVEDNGKGIAAENLKKVFDKFYRVDQHLKKMEAGFGLGLAICKKIIDLHEGKLWAESDGLGKGSRFIFTIPVS